MLKSINKKRARQLAIVLQKICLFMTFFFVFTVVLALLGRVQVALDTPDQSYDSTLLLESDRSESSQSMYISMSKADIRIDAYDTDGSIDFATWLGVAMIVLTQVLPIGFCFLTLSGFFANIANDMVFVAGNADILQRCGVVLIAESIAAPLLSTYVIPSVINIFSDNILSVDSSISWNILLFGICFLVMAYVFRYGLFLQDEADYTL